MDFSSMCRTCLSTKYLNPIFKDGEDHSRYSTTLFDATGLKIQVNDGLPQQMCHNCVKLLHRVIKFREQSKDAEAKLLSLKNHCEDVKIYSDPYGKRKRSKNSTKDIDIKIERDTTEKEDEIPLYKLFKNTPNTEYQPVKDESRYLHIEIEDVCLETETDSINNFVKNNSKTETNLEIEDLNEQPNDELKYEAEYLDLDFEIYSNTELEKIDITDAEVDINESLNDVTNTENMPFIVHDTKRVICKLCQKNLSRRSIDSHMSKRHPGADARKVKCDLCDTYVLRQRLNRHMIMMHGKDCFRCGYCKTEYDNRELLLGHVPTCTAKRKRQRSVDSVKRKELIVECDLCHKMMQKASLRMHKEIKHAGMGPVCEHCGRRFGNKFRLKEHLRAKHGYEKFKCSFCDFKSASSMSIRDHERRHRGEKPFACDTCGAKFHARHLLTQHKQSHRTEKTMKCDQCPAAFKANNTLHMHKLTCHNAHTYQCTMCPRTYSCRHYAVKHLRNVHRFLGPVGNLHRSESRRDPGTLAEPERDADAKTVVAVVNRVEPVE